MIKTRKECMAGAVGGRRGFTMKGVSCIVSPSRESSLRRDGSGERIRREDREEGRKGGRWGRGRREEGRQGGREGGK